jgi:hypothetical protein
VEGAVTVIEPAAPAAGSPWAFRADPVTRDSAVDLALLSKGFRVVVGPVPYNADGPSRAHWDKVYAHLTEHGFAKRVVMEGAGGAAGVAYAWAIANPDKVACVYAENPVMRSTMRPVTSTPLIDGLAPLAKANVAILHSCRAEAVEGSKLIEKRYKEAGGKLTVVGDEPRDREKAVEFIVSKAK